MEVCFILVHPAVPGNVGAAARAIKTMGFWNLRLINPCNHLDEEALTMAHGSRDILEKAEVFPEDSAALADLDLVIATTAKERIAKHDYHSSRDIFGLLEKKHGQLRKVGILFGTEESGLPNRLVLEADLVMSIPMVASYPSLNLAQAVMITAYELSPLNRLQKPGQVLEKSGEGWSELRQRTRSWLVESGIPEGSPLFHRIMERMATVGAGDIQLFLSVISRLPKT